MLLHYSRTVLAAAIWTFLLKSSVQETISNETIFKRLESRAISEFPIKLFDRSQNRVNTINASENARSNNETKEIGDSTTTGIIIGNDGVDDRISYAVVKRHVREQPQSHKILSTRISHVNTEGNNIHTGITERSHNDGASIFQKTLKGSFDPAFRKENINVVRADTDEGTKLLKTHTSNIPKAMMTSKPKMEDDTIVSLESSLKDTAHTERDSKLSKASNSFVPVITNSKGLAVNPETRNSRGSSDDSRFIVYSSLNDISRGKNKMIGKLIESSVSDRTNNFGYILSPNAREKISHFGTKFITGNVVNVEENKEKRFTENTKNPMDKTSMFWEKNHSRNIAIIKQENIVNNKKLDRNEISEDKAMEKMRVSRRQEVLSSGQKSSNIDIENEDERKNSAIRKLRNQVDYQVSTMVSENLFGMKANRVTVPSSVNHITARFTMVGEISREPSKELSGQISKPPDTRGLPAEMSLSTRNMAEAYVDSTSSYFFIPTPSYPRVLSERRHLKKSRGMSLEMEDLSYRREREQKRALQKINYLRNERDERRSYFASLLNNEPSGTTGRKVRIVGIEKTEKNEISRERRYHDTWNNKNAVGTLATPTNVDNELSPSHRNPSQDTMSKINGNVVKTMTVGFKMDNDAHKGLIGQKFTGNNDLRMDQEDRVQERGKQVNKFSLDMRPMKIDVPHEQKNKKVSSSSTSWRASPLGNTEVSSSLWLVVKRENSALNSITRVTRGRTRKMEFSGSEKSRESQKIKSISGNSDGKRDVFSKKSTSVAPGTVQFSQATTMDAPSDDGVVENRENFIEKIYQPARTDMPPSMSSPRVEAHPGDFVTERDAVDDDNVRNDDRETTKVLGSSGFQLRQDKVFHQRGENDIRGEILSNIHGESRILNVSLDTLVTDTSVTTESNAMTVDSAKVRLYNEKHRRNQWLDSTEDVARNSQATSNSSHFFTLLSDKRSTDEITGVTNYDTFHEKLTVSDDYDRTNEQFASHRNYMGNSKINETNEPSIVNRLELRDSTGYEMEDSPEVQKNTKNHINDEISRLELCDTCKIGAIVGSTKNEQRSGIFVIRDREMRSSNHVENSTKKMSRSINDVEPLKRTLRSEAITKGNEISVLNEFMVGHEASLANTSVKPQIIDRTGPEARIGEKIQGRNTKTSVRDREAIINAAEARNLIVPKGGTLAPLRASSVNIEKLRGNVEPIVSLDKILDRRNEQFDSFPGSNHEVESRQLNPTVAMGKKTVEEKHKTMIARFVETPESKRTAEISNNTDGIPGDRENFRENVTFQMKSTNGRDKPWKILVHDDATTSLTSSTKIDSFVESIDRISHKEGTARIEDLFEGSQQDIQSAGTTGDIAEPSKARMKQLKREFTRKDPLSIAKATSLSYDREILVATEAPNVRDAKSTEKIPHDPMTLNPSQSSTMETVKSLKRNEPVSNKRFTISMAHPTTVNPSITNTVNENSAFAKVPYELSSTYSSITELDELFESHENLVNKTTSISSTEPTNVNFTIMDTGDYNPALASTVFGRDNNSSMKSSRESVERLVLASNKQQSRETVAAENLRVTLDARTLNQTMHDNSTRITATLNQWPVKHSAVVEGDLVLGGLMMVHEREDSVTCGPVMPQGGVQALEAMLYTLDWLNKRDLVPGVKIGAHILDDCDKDTYGLEMAVDFIKGSISNIDGAEYHCNKTAVRKVISGVVGAASSVTSIQVANLLRLFRIPQVSFFSTSPELSNKMRFEYFTRTIPSDHYQVKAMVDIVLVMGWSYVSIIYEESNYGEKAYEELEKLLGKHQVCIAVKEKLSKDSGVAEAYVYDNIVLKLLTKPRARGCIIFASDQEVAGVMRAVRRCNATGAFSWIGSDGWSARSLVSDGNEPEMEGTLSVQPQANPVEGFQDYFLNLTVENNRRNPWFVEFWEDHFKCRYPNASQTPYNNYTDECTTTERLSKHNTAFEDQLQFVSDAVLAFAYAFRNMHSDLCHGKPGLCDAMKPTKGTELLSYLRAVEFGGLSGDVFHFDKNGDGPARYNIIHFKQISPGKYKWIRVGKYLEGELRLNMSEIQFRLGHPEAPESVCSLPCEVGQAKKYVEGESCCWHCFNCTQYQIRHVNDEKQCVLCPRGTVPDETHSYCRDIPEEFLRPESGWAIGAMSFSSTGILITLFVGGVFLKHNDTPIVRASGRELSYVLLTGILLCYLVTFALVLRPTDLVCSIQRFSAGFCFTVVYAALLTKTNRISRIFNAGKRSAKRPSFISPRSQLIICSMLVAVQILINGVWMVIDPAKARHHYPSREDNLLVCNSYIDASYMIAFTYPIILIVVCTVYAVLTRKIPEAFNESKHIGFTMYTTCVIWLAFVPLYFATGSHVALRITSMSVTISLSASVTIACLFTPKLYIILIHPERNVRPNMMHNRCNTTKGSVVTATNASSMMAPVTLTAITCDQNKAVKKHVITTIDCSTQIEQFEMELKDQKNGKLPATVITRSTQTPLNNNGKDSSVVTSPVIKDIGIDENIKVLNIAKIGNGPLSQNEAPL